MRVFFSFSIGTRKHGQRTAAWEAQIPGLGFRYLGPAALAGLAAALAHPALVTWDVFLGFQDPVHSSVIESGQKWGPNCADDVPVRGARVRASYRNISCTTGTPFWLDWDQGGSKTQTKLSGHFKRPAAPPKSQHHEHHKACLGPQFPSPLTPHI